MSENVQKENIQEFEALKGDFDSVWRPLYQDIADYLVPRKSQINTKKTPGVDGYTDRLYNLSAQEAVMTLSSGITSASTPATENWAAYQPQPQLLRASGRDKVRKYYAECTQIAMRALAASNFYSAVFELHLERSAFGTCCWLVQEGKRALLNFKVQEVGSYAFAEDDDGFVNRWGREFVLKAHQAVEKWGESNVGPLIAQSNSGTPEQRKKEFHFVHMIKPRVDRDASTGGTANSPFKDCYVCREDPSFYIEGGFFEWPVPVSRFYRWPGEIWGWGPGVESLPLTRQLNFMERMLDNGLEKIVDPPLLVPSYLAGQVDSRAAGETIFDENKPALPKEWQMIARLDAMDARIERKEDQLRRIFHNDLFRAISDIEPGKMTAYETMQRVSEKMDRFAPAGTRIQTEIIQPTMLRVFAILQRAGAFPEAPEEVLEETGEGTLEPIMPAVQFQSKLALALRSMENKSLVDLQELISPLAEAKPDMMDWLDTDEIMTGAARNLGFPERWIRKERDVTQIRDARARDAARQAQLEDAATRAKAAGDLGSAPPELVEQMQGSNGGGVSR